MSRRNNPAKWVLPEQIDPTERRCIQIQVPDDPAHIAAFRGALLALASAYNWADDPTHKAKEVALVWREILDSSLEWGCGLQTKIRVDDICTLSWSYDDWVTFDSYDPSGCILANIDSVVPGLIQNAIRDAIADGTIQGGNAQNSPTQAPAPGTCKTYHVRLNGRDKWRCPSPVNSGDTVLITNTQGGYWDGGIAGTWSCPDGKYYGLGNCFGEWSAQAEDPLQSGLHMQLVGNFDTTFFDAIGSTYTIPQGVTDAPLYIQANDSNLSDNIGEVQFDVEICSVGTLDWLHSWDFTVSAAGWLRTYGTYEAGIGLKTVQESQGNNSMVLDYHHNLLHSSTATYVRVRGTYEPGSNPQGYALEIGQNNYATDLFNRTQAAMSNSYDYAAYGSWGISNNVLIAMSVCTQCGTGLGTVSHFEIGGTGADPFAE